MEHGQPLRENAKVNQLLKDVGQRLMIAEREMDAVPIKKPPSAPAAATSAEAATPAAASAVRRLCLVVQYAIRPG